MSDLRRTVRAIVGVTVAFTLVRRILLGGEEQTADNASPDGKTPMTGVDPSPDRSSEASPADVKLMWRSVRAEAVIAAGLAAAVFGATWWLEQRIDERAELRENVRFVRQSVMDDTAEKPFDQLNLAGAELSGLDLGCEQLDRQTGCARMRFIDLGGAILARTDLAGADLTGADFQDAYMELANLVETDLAGADLARAALLGARLTRADLERSYLAGAGLALASLAGADLTDADLTGADLELADLTGADLTGATLDGANLRSLCYDGTTAWPSRFKPPAAHPGTCSFYDAYDEASWEQAVEDAERRLRNRQP